jgi:hypothetical protein
MVAVRTPAPRVRRAGIGTAAVVASLLAPALLGACAKEPAPISAPTAGPATGPSAAPSASADTRPLAPLTAKPMDPAAAGRSAVAVVVAGANPVGLDKADVVIEEVSSPVRWLAVYHSQDASSVGPVVATRPADLMVLSVLRPAYAYRGGTTGMVEQAEKSALLSVNSTSHSSAYASSGDQLFTSTAKVRAAVKAPAARPMLVFGDGTAGAGGYAGSKVAKKLTITVRGGVTQTWAYDAAVKVWRRTGGGPAVAAANVIVQVVPYKSIQLGHPTGQWVPSARVFGGGSATIAAGQLAVPGKWSKPGLPKQTNFVDSSSVPVRLVPGTSWLLLAPTGSTVAVS